MHVSPGTEDRESLNPTSSTRVGTDHDSDIPYIESTLSSKDIDGLLQHGSLSVQLPGQEQLSLTLNTHQHITGTDRITLTSTDTTGFTSALTRRGETFYLTLATEAGSYRIEGDAQGSRIYPHQLLAYRQISHAKDYRYAPHASE